MKSAARKCLFFKSNNLGRATISSTVGAKTELKLAGRCSRGCGWNWLGSVLRQVEVSWSGGKVNGLMGGLGERLPAVDLSHGDLA
jgi:hypothetical protein